MKSLSGIPRDVFMKVNLLIDFKKYTDEEFVHIKQ